MIFAHTASALAPVTMLVAEDRADHIDLNFGCPVAKVTRRGGGAALPWKIGLFREIVERAVKAAGDVPLTVKMRKGIDDEVAKEVLDEVNPADEEAAARALVRKKLRSLSRVDETTATRRLVGMLARKGYPPGMAYSVVKDELSAPEHD